MSLETSKYDIIYSKLLQLEFTPARAKGLAKILHEVVKQTGYSIDQALQYVDATGIRFDIEIYQSLNEVRTNSSQIGYIDREYIPPSILRQIPTPNPTPTAAYFRVTDGVGPNDFVIKLTDPEKIQNARDQLNNVVPKLHLTGLIIKSTASYNPNYSYHYDPDTIDFFEVAMEVCDATFNYTEDNLADAGGAFLPGLRLCPWFSLLVEEVAPAGTR